MDSLLGGGYNRPMSQGSLFGPEEAASQAASPAAGRRSARGRAGGPEPRGPAGRPPTRLLRAADFAELPPPLGPGVMGLDEAGRGPLAGPVYAAACVLPSDFPLELLDDSKALSAKARDEAFARIVADAVAYRVDWAGPSEIGELNILGASLLAMRRAAAGLLEELRARGLAAPEAAYVDGNRDPGLGLETACVVGGDALVPAIMAASILAKVARDRAMERFDWLYPGYGYAAHKGYPTAAHRDALARLGPSPIQRPGFRF